MDGKQSSLKTLSLFVVLLPLAGLVYLFANQKETSTPEPTVAKADVVGIDDSSFAEKQRSLPAIPEEEPSTLIIDLREQDDFMQGHLVGSINIPYSVIVSGDYSLPQNAEVIFYIGEDENIDIEQLKTSLATKGITEAKFLETPFGDVQETYNIPLEIGTNRGEGPTQEEIEALSTEERLRLVNTGELPEYYR